METGENLTLCQTVLERLRTLDVGEGIEHGNMVVFPLFLRGIGHPLPRLEYRTLGEAILEGSVTVRERGGGTVPELVLHNRGDVMVLVLDGEEITGGKQNRIVNASFLVGTGDKVVIPVSCVEAGRWHETSDVFAVGEGLDFDIRREKDAQVRMGLRNTGRHSANQAAIWESLAVKQEEMHVSSSTGAMNDIYRSRRETLEDYEAALAPVAGAAGLIVAMNGHIAGADLFDQERTAAILWPKLIRSYSLDAIDGEKGGPVGRERAVRLLERVRDANCEVFPSLALGHDVRFEGTGATGAALVYMDVVVHAAIFRTHGTGTGNNTGTRLARSSVRSRSRFSRPAGGEQV
ncbi:MAG: hypothetical protein M1319_05195 [Chloroflexi bacterium]|nr:hypothetical protein [Chloroflexota bacterium]